MTFYFEYILENFLLPGQIENWVVIMDLYNMGLWSLPINNLKTIMGYLSNNYRSRLYKCYIVNTPGTISIPWNIVKGFLEQNTIDKISFYDTSIPTLKNRSIFDHVNKSQLEKRYGGTAPEYT